ncbi:MAG: hypothetical protein Q8P41_26625 [Pseudomonadota bacterium]|nr:hypothetical protein [Pseudomonadota bacterium]
MTATETNNPRWWGDSHTSNWDRIKEAMRRDWEQTKSDLTGGDMGTDLRQDASDTLDQARGKQPIPMGDVPNPMDADDVKKAARAQEKVALALDAEFERGVKPVPVPGDRMRWEDAELPMRFGHGASTHYSDNWDDTLEPKLRADWEASYPGRSWEEARELARTGWNHARPRV